MSALLPNHSKFYYGYKISAEPYNGYIDLDEGSGPISVLVPVGSYTLNEFVIAIQQALSTQAVLSYTVSADRETRRITISASANFSILSNTGTHSGSGVYSLIGFETSSNYTGSNSYSGIKPSGKCYTPQFLLQSYVGPDDWQEKTSAKVNVSASATSVEVVNFGLAKFAQFNIDYITNKTMDGVVIRNRSAAVEEVRDFLQYITAKNYFEFMPSEDDSNTFYKVLCESTEEYQDGTGYRLQEKYDEGLPGVFKTGIIKMRVL
jgi:hypothetical protein